MQLRVYELGRHLRDRGLELSAKEMAQHLSAAGYEVASHTSTISFDELEQALACLKRSARPLYSPRLAAAISIAQSALGSYVEPRMSTAFGRAWRSYLCDTAGVRLESSEAGERQYWDWPALAGAIRALNDDGVDPQARVDGEVVGTFFEVKRIRDSHSHGRPIPEGDIGTTLRRIPELLVMIGDEHSARRAERLPEEL